jgi:hypothetical protein
MTPYVNLNYIGSFVFLMLDNSYENIDKFLSKTFNSIFSIIFLNKDSIDIAKIVFKSENIDTILQSKKLFLLNHECIKNEINSLIFILQNNTQLDENILKNLQDGQEYYRYYDVLYFIKYNLMILKLFLIWNCYSYDKNELNQYRKLSGLNITKIDSIFEYDYKKLLLSVNQKKVLYNFLKKLTEKYKNIYFF